MFVSRHLWSLATRWHRYAANPHLSQALALSFRTKVATEWMLHSKWNQNKRGLRLALSANGEQSKRREHYPIRGKTTAACTGTRDIQTYSRMKYDRSHFPAMSAMKNPCDTDFNSDNASKASTDSAPVWLSPLPPVRVEAPPTGRSE